MLQAVLQILQSEQAAALGIEGVERALLRGVDELALH